LVSNEDRECRVLGLQDGDHDHHGEDRMKIGDTYRHGVFTIATCARRLEIADVGAFGVVEGSDIVGIITERDLVRALSREDDPAGAIVRDFMCAICSPRTWRRTRVRSPTGCSTRVFVTCRS
jgi:hypothetical protein